MAEKLQTRLRPLQIEDVETVATFEREIAKISFPDDPGNSFVTDDVTSADADAHACSTHASNVTD